MTQVRFADCTGSLGDSFYRTHCPVCQPETTDHCNGQGQQAARDESDEKAADQRTRIENTAKDDQEIYIHLSLHLGGDEQIILGIRAGPVNNITLARPGIGLQAGGHHLDDLLGGDGSLIGQHLPVGTDQNKNVSVAQQPTGKCYLSATLAQCRLNKFHQAGDPAVQLVDRFFL